MKFTEVMGCAFLCVIAVMTILGLTWIAQGNEFFLYKFFAPKTEAVRREVFEQSKAYRQGAVQELQSMEFQYEQADEGHKAALRGIILHRAADLDPEVMPIDLRQFITQLKHS